MRISLIILFLGFLSQATQAQLPQGAVAHYTFDQNDARDQIGYGGDGIISGSPIPTAGVSGNAFYFDGGNHSITFTGGINKYLSGTRDFSISFFLRAAPGQISRSVMGKRHSCKGKNMFDIRIGRNLGVELYEREYPRRIRSNVGTRLNDNKWHHYVYVRRRNQVFLYKDGELIDRNESGYVIGISDLVDFSINDSPCKRRDGTQNLVGSLDELLIYRNALSRREVSRIYNYFKNQTPPPIAENRELDPRMYQIFGNYYDSTSESPSQLLLEKRTFTLTVMSPEAYSTRERATLTGTYRIAAGKIYLTGTQMILEELDENGETKSQRRVTYQGGEIIGDIYDEVIIDINAFDTRLKFRKASSQYKDRQKIYRC